MKECAFGFSVPMTATFWKRIHNIMAIQLTMEEVSAMFPFMEGFKKNDVIVFGNSCNNGKILVTFSEI